MKEPTEFVYFKAWIIFFLVATLAGGLASLVAGSFVAAFLGAGGASIGQINRIVGVVGFAIGIPTSYLTFRIVIGKYLLPKLESDD